MRPSYDASSVNASDAQLPPSTAASLHGQYLPEWIIQNINEYLAGIDYCPQMNPVTEPTLQESSSDSRYNDISNVLSSNARMHLDTTYKDQSPHIFTPASKSLARSGSLYPIPEHRKQALSNLASGPDIAVEGSSRRIEDASREVRRHGPLLWTPSL
ncbi:hypothetical protein ETB97_002749 [Aspergillus alliaceus]|uniref:Uncharacterized protein n=1 Tax=Petromyces alliaceus TaxID=209559 RepID=A0A8H6E4Y7_PETAA|nr:hypothetical protein ETB97_002749 [Aspergillus burnettii]